MSVLFKLKIGGRFFEKKVVGLSREQNKQRFLCPRFLFSLSGLLIANFGWRILLTEKQKAALIPLPSKWSFVLRSSLVEWLIEELIQTYRF